MQAHNSVWVRRQGCRMDKQKVGWRLNRLGLTSWFKHFISTLARVDLPATSRTQPCTRMGEHGAAVQQSRQKSIQKKWDPGKLDTELRGDARNVLRATSLRLEKKLAVHPVQIPTCSLVGGAMGSVFAYIRVRDRFALLTDASLRYG